MGDCSAEFRTILKAIFLARFYLRVGPYKVAPSLPDVLSYSGGLSLDSEPGPALLVSADSQVRNHFASHGLL
jgi:hypothetical protein